MEILDLSGSWFYRTDYEDNGVKDGYYREEFESGGFKLPGSACGNGIGKKQEYYEEPSKEALRAPRERYEYVAPLWLQRKVDIPEDFAGKYIRLFLERVNAASELWIDGEKTGRQIIELSAPHIYDVTGKLTAGEHMLTLRIDNRNLLNIDTMASGYSVDTQGYWNGIIGRMELQCEEVFHLENIQVYPDENGISVKLTETSDVYSPFERRRARIALSVTGPDGKESAKKCFTHELFNARQVEYLRYERHEIEGIQYWDEFTPVMYTLHVKYECGDSVDEKSVRFGMRTIRTKNRQILLNNKPIALRGTTDCAIYPLTGYPPTDMDTWRKNFMIIKSYGLNHVRFHAWCPPEAAFCAADEIGLYLSVEMPLWLNRDVCALAFGEDGAHRAYYPQEAVTISKTYGNHPSFLMFSNGNEIMGDFELLDDIMIQMKAYDKRRIYTLTTNFDHPVLPCEDYLCAYEAGGHKVRMQDIQDTAAESTGFDYSKAVRDVPVPVISFEIGQYCVYPDVDAVEKYTGNMLPVNFDVIRRQMIKKGIYHRLGDYIEASGNLAVKLYKEEIEAALRTKDFGGFELLSLCDYTGQGTATVGILDVFFNSKGFIGSEQFREFCNCAVPLFKAGRIFRNTETLEAELDLYDYGQTRMEQPLFELKIYRDGGVFYQLQTTGRKISIPLNHIEKSSRLKVELTVGSYKNTWNVYVYAAKAGSHQVTVIKDKENLARVIEAGGRAIVTADCVKNPVDGSFIPVFWSPVHFPSQRPCGAVIDDRHPVFADFPTEKYIDYQWKGLLDHSKGMETASFGKEFRPIVETVPNFMDNTPGSPLFEARVGCADILFCGFDLDAADISSGQLKECIYSYVDSDLFRPENRIDERLFMDLFR